MMDKNKELLVRHFIGLQGYALNNARPGISYNDCDWETLISLGWMNKCGALFNNAVNKDPEYFNVEKSLMDKWNRMVKKEFIYSYNKFSEFKKVITCFNREGIQAIVLKGYVLAVLYPDIFSRYSSDLDVKFAPRDKDRVHEILTKELGFGYNEADSKNNVQLYSNDNLSIEAHYTLWEDYHGDNIDVLLKEKLDDADTLIQVTISDDISVWTLGPTEHLILQMFHIIKHYIVEGIESRYFTDIALFINRYKDSIDFNRFFRVFRQMKFDNFCAVYLTKCIEYFGMDESVLSKEDRVYPEDDMEFLSDIVFVGKRDLSDKSSYSLLGILSPYVNGKKETGEKKGSRVLQALFPSVNDIDDKYSYCKKFHFLLPIAWVHRAIRTIYFKLTKGSEVYGVKDKIKGSEYRIRMMKNSKIL
ncbi:MAG: nucleotidyltransferase family protein [Butyrivibrio sp.]|uniref:nucleotidyltransferase family protein n=1 Tax=Butyrivibrio sp. TaxID=28121 RepID=UPI0025D02199|nr:nucleotidyltransferase family protein [Butyrivibrio sp.]MCR5772118.1 nucleotidyltransferase family protein [Butyrivibrio sp.]